MSIDFRERVNKGREGGREGRKKRERERQTDTDVREKHHLVASCV